MRRILIGIGSLAAVLLAAVTAGAQPPIKIGLIMPYSGQFADTAAQMDAAIKLYVQQKGDTVAGRKLEFIRRDTGGVAPDVAKRLAQELVVRDQVDVLGGFILTPNALAAADVSAEAKKFMVVMNAATSIITTKSPYLARTSVTTPQLNEVLGAWAYRNGVRKAYTMVSDYGPGIDAEGAFQRAFKEAGGEIIGSVRFPVANPDFSAFVQRAKDLNPEAIYIFVPGGVQPAALGKALADRGIDPKKIHILGQGEFTEEEALRSMGDTGLGIITAFHYDYNHDSAMNRDFVKAFHAVTGRNPEHLQHRRVGWHPPDLRGAEEDRRQDRRRLPHRGGQGHAVGKPAGPRLHRPGDPRHRPDGLHPPGGQGRGPAPERGVRQGRERQGPGEGPHEAMTHRPS